MSVDMGIRNLAFCAIDTPPPNSNAPFLVRAWERLDLLRKKDSPNVEESEIDTTVTTPSPPRTSHRPRKPQVPINRDSFTPSSMSRTAYEVTQHLLRHQPESILIERQRFRSGGGAAIQEWTVRVNMLESMLWACIETLRASKTTALEKFPETTAVSPARVANFWLANPHMALRPPEDILSPSKSKASPSLGGASEDKKKVEKKDKICLVRSWVAGDADVKLEFDSNTSAIAKAFDPGTSAKVAEQLAGGKLDDLADCLLQGVAVARWEENRRAIKEFWDERVREMER